MLNFASPVPTNSKISQYFNERPAFYKPLGFKGHPGIDYAIRVGTPIVSVLWGEIIEIGWSNKGWGAYIKIKYDNYIAIYAHLSVINVVRGCYVTKGQKIGRSGNTGLSSGPHLHFGIQDPKKINNGNKGYIDPLLFLQESDNSYKKKLDKIKNEIEQIKEDAWTKKSMYIHCTYIDKILSQK